MGDCFLEIKIQEGFNIPTNLYLTEESVGRLYICCACIVTAAAQHK